MSVISLKIKFTDAGKAAIVNPANIGTSELEITTIELGSAAYDPTGSEIALQTPVKTLATFGGDVVASNVIHVSIRDESNDTYQVGEIGLWSGAGVLMGIISASDTPIITEKGVNDILLIAADAEVIDVDVSNLTFGTTDFIYPPATTDSSGIVQLAKEPEVDNGDPNKVIDAKELQALLTRRLTAALNENDSSKLASAAAVFALNQAIANINTILASDDTALDEIQEIVNYIKLNRTDLDALSIASIAGLQDALDGKALSGHSHSWSFILGKPSTYPPSAHGHTAADISGLLTIDLSKVTQVWSGSKTSVRFNGTDGSWQGNGFYLVRHTDSGSSNRYSLIYCRTDIANYASRSQGDVQSNYVSSVRFSTFGGINDFSVWDPVNGNRSIYNIWKIG